MIPKNYALIYPNMFNYTVYKIIELLFLIDIYHGKCIIHKVISIFLCLKKLQLIIDLCEKINAIQKNYMQFSLHVGFF